MREILSNKWAKFVLFVVLAVLILGIGERVYSVSFSGNTRECFENEVTFLPIINYSGNNYLLLEGSNKKIWIGGLIPVTPRWLEHPPNQFRLLYADESKVELIQYMWRYEEPDDECRVTLLIEGRDSKLLIEPEDFPSGWNIVDYYQYFDETNNVVGEISFDFNYETLLLKFSTRPDRNWWEFQNEGLSYREEIQIHSSITNAQEAFNASREFNVSLGAQCSSTDADNLSFCPCELVIPSSQNFVEGCVEQIGSRFALLQVGPYLIEFRGEGGDAWQTLIPIAVEKILSQVEIDS